MQNITRVWIGDPHENGHFNGTAFFVDESTLLTAKHVILDMKGEKYENIFLSNTPDGGITPIISIILCELDIAILKVKKIFKINNNKIIFSNKLSVGDTVNVVGFYDKSTSKKNYENRVSGYQNNEHIYELQNHLTNGLSGSPVLLGERIAGIIISINSRKNLTYVIPIEEVCVKLKIEQKSDEVLVLKSKQNKSRTKSLSEFIIPVIMPGIIIMIIFYLLTLLLFSNEFFQKNYSFYIFISFLLAKLYTYIKGRK